MDFQVKYLSCFVLLASVGFPVTSIASLSQYSQNSGNVGSDEVVEDIILEFTNMQTVYGTAVNTTIYNNSVQFVKGGGVTNKVTINDAGELYLLGSGQK